MKYLSIFHAFEVEGEKELLYRIEVAANLIFLKSFL